MRLAACILLSVLSMTLDHRFELLQGVRSALSIVVFPIKYLVDLPVNTGQWLGENFASRETLLAEISSLETKQMMLNVRLQKLASLEQENLRLRQLLDSSYRVTEKVLIAELMSVDLEPFNRQIVINRGGRHGVYEGQPLLDAHGVMGQVTQVGPLTSTAMLVTDPNHAVPVAVNRNGLRAVALGTGTREVLDVPHFPAHADIRVGDLLVTSGLGGRFPRGYPVAKVIQVNVDPSRPFAEVHAEPTAQLQRGREVLLIWPNQPVLEPQMAGDGG